MFKLPLWVLPDRFPSIYESESFTAIEMTSKLYGAMKVFAEEYNEFAEKINMAFTEFEHSSDKNYELFTASMRQEFQDFIGVVELKLMGQDKEIDDAVLYMKKNIFNTTRDILTEMLEKYDLTLGRVKVHFPFKGYHTGDCTIIETENHVVMIDCGVEGCQDMIIDYMVQNNITRIDYFFISHLHHDHVGKTTGLVKFLDDERIDTSEISFYFPHWLMDENKLIGSNYPKEYYNFYTDYFDNHGVTYVHPLEDSTLLVDDCHFTFNNLSEHYFEEYYPVTYNCLNENSNATSYNNFSMVVQMEHGVNKFLFAGDIEEKAESLIYDKIKSPDVVKIQHHGQNVTTDKNFLKRITPKYAVVCDLNTDVANTTCRREMFNKCRLSGTVFSTNMNGSIVITSDEYGLRAESENGNVNEARYKTLDSGIGLKYGADLNTILEVGEYYTRTSSFTNSLANCPHRNSGMKMVVEQTSPGSNNGIRQTIYASNNYAGTVVTRCYYNNEWYPWTTLTPLSEGFLLTSGTDLNNCIDSASYISNGDTLTASIVNKPSDLTTNFKMIVHTITQNHVKQIILCGKGEPQVFYMRHIVRGTGGYVTPWYKFTGTQM